MQMSGKIPQVGDVDNILFRPSALQNVSRGCELQTLSRDQSKTDNA